MRRGEIEYARAAGQYVAFRELVGENGGGHEIVMVSGRWPMESLQDDPVAERLLEGLAALGRLIVFDRRGFGASDPLADWDTPLCEQWAEDLAAVIEAAACARPTVFSWVQWPVARTCSVRYPGLIGGLVLFNPWIADGMGEFRDELERRRRGGQATWDPDWFPERWKEQTFRAWAGSAARAGVGPSHVERVVQKMASDPPFDDRLVDTPTLVINRSPADFFVPKDYLRRAAGAIRGARRVDLGDGDAVPFGLGVDDLLVAVSEFVAGEVHLPPPERLLTAIVFTDLVDSTRRAASSGDADWKRLLDLHDAVSRAEVARCGGDVIKTTGDGVLALLPSATAAIEAAGHVRDRLGEEHLDVRVGIHVGEIDRRGHDVSGLAVHIAARIMSAADPGQILVTPMVTQVARSGSFRGVGERILKGVDGLWELFAVEPDHARPA
jgi:class 3 adenylate cyclase